MMHRRMVSVKNVATVVGLLLGVGCGPGLAPAADPDGPAQKVDAEDPVEAERNKQLLQHARNLKSKYDVLLYAHLELLRSVCGEIPRATRQAILNAGRQAVEEQSLELARRQFAPQQLNNGIAPKKEKAGESRDGIATALETVVRERVGDREAAAFRAELDGWRDRWKRSTVRSCIALLDSDLCLTAAQRMALEQSLLEHWHDGMFMTMNHFAIFNGRRVVMGLPADVVRRHLNEQQTVLYDAAGDLRAHVGVHQDAVMLLLHTIPRGLGADSWWSE